MTTRSRLVAASVVSPLVCVAAIYLAAALTMSANNVPRLLSPTFVVACSFIWCLGIFAPIAYATRNDRSMTTIRLTLVGAVLGALSAFLPIFALAALMGHGGNSDAILSAFAVAALSGAVVGGTVSLTFALVSGITNRSGASA